MQIISILLFYTKWYINSYDTSVKFNRFKKKNSIRHRSFYYTFISVQQPINVRGTWFTFMIMQYILLDIQEIQENVEYITYK